MEIYCSNWRLKWINPTQTPGPTWSWLDWKLGNVPISSLNSKPTKSNICLDYSMNRTDLFQRAKGLHYRYIYLCSTRYHFPCACKCKYKMETSLDSPSKFKLFLLFFRLLFTFKIFIINATVQKNKNKVTFNKQRQHVLWNRKLKWCEAFIGGRRMVAVRAS